jgi:RNA polymerase sigma-70 factor (ECF subfamily)
LKNPDDRESWQDFFNIYSNLIRAVALKAGLTESEAQEALQETMIALSRSLPKFEYDAQKGKFKGWLLKLTRWRIDDQFRKRRFQSHPFTDRDSGTTRTATVARIPDPHGGDLEAIWEEEWKQHLFQAALERVKLAVDVRQYNIFDLYVVQQWPAEKVARVLEIPVGRVFLAKHRVLALVKKEVNWLESQLE